jgi:hypothetical protein
VRGYSIGAVVILEDCEETLVSVATKQSPSTFTIASIRGY